METQNNGNLKGDFVKKLSEMVKTIGIDKLLIIAICGVALVILSIPSEKEKNIDETLTNELDEKMKTQVENQQDYTRELEERLENFLRNIKGVGAVEVMITLEHTGEEVILYEQPYSKSNSNLQEQDGSQHIEEVYDYEETVVFQRNSNGAELPYVISVKQPEIRGMAIVCQGGEQPELAMKITSLIEALFHISAHKISVIGMK